jgi:histone deacetylase 11
MRPWCLDDPLDPRVIYSPGYDIYFLGFEQLHPFDGRKYSRAWRAARRSVGPGLEARTLRPPHPIEWERLLRVHSAGYLRELRGPRCVARVVELPVLARLPAFMLDRYILRPMRLGAMGTLLAAQHALRGGLALNLGGGYHHASHDRGEGFCFYADIPAAVAALRAAGRREDDGPGLSPEARVLIVDLDAHQGNGHERYFGEDAGVFIVDLYNREIFPQDRDARRRIDVDRPLRAGTDDRVYLATLEQALDLALRSGPFGLAFVVAGADVHEADLLGGLCLTGDGLRTRDRMALRRLRQAGVPAAVVGAGGYGRESYLHLAGLAEMVMEAGEA